MLKSGFKIKIIIPTVVVLVALVVVLNIFLSLRFSALSDTLVNEKLSSNVNSLKLFLDNGKAASRAAAISMAQNSYAINALKERNTNELLRVFAPTHDLYHINYYTICDSEGVVLARTHEPENFGDSVLNQQNIKDALAGKVSTYFEAGSVVRVSLRSGSPVYDSEGTLIGVVSAGVRFDTPATVEELKKLFHSEITVFSGNTRIATTITRDGQSIVGTTLDPRIAEIVIENKQEYLGDAAILGENYKTFYMPLLNAQDEAFATFFLGLPRAEVVTELNKTIRDGIMLGLAGLLVSIVLLFFIISSISAPITKLSADMDSIADGNLSIAINAKSNDEVGHLAKSFQKVADTIHKLHNEINIMIAEHEKGNTDYCLNTEEFRGDYKTLALSVLKFADSGMRDELTGLANRRSFDNRMGWEWKHAIQDTAPISVLIVDIDNFKTYNDKYGHQQGEAAMQAVATVLRQSLRPSKDFAARLDSDDFIVLLPSMDSAGAVSVAERIHMEVANTLVPCAELDAIKITVSIGVNTQVPTPGKQINSFISMADDALHKAKEAGKNKVVFNGEGNS